MTITVGGTAITFNDGTTQSTAGGTVNTTNVLAATAGASVGAVGTYAFMRITASTGNINPGGTLAGSSLRYGAQNGGSTTAYSSITPAGTWRVMGYGWQDSAYSISGVSVWLRIS